MSKLIYSRFKGKCSSCGAAHERGAYVWYRKGVRGVRCQRCGPEQPDPQPASAADSARSSQNGAAAVSTTADVLRVEFGSVTECIGVALDTSAGQPMARAKVNLYAEKHWGGDDAWLRGYRNSAEVLAELSRPGGRRIHLIETLRNALVDAVPLSRAVRRRIRRRCEWGDTLDPELVSQRVAECWERSERVRESGGVVRIAVNVSTPCHDDGSIVGVRGAAASLLADHLATLGHSVEVVAFHCGTQLSPVCPRMVSATLVKRADMPMDLAALAAAVADVAITRLQMLAACRFVPGELAHSLGKVSNLSPEQDAPGFDYVINPSDVHSLPTARAWLEAAVHPQVA